MGWVGKAIINANGVNGNIMVSKTIVLGSSPSLRAKFERKV